MFVFNQKFFLVCHSHNCRQVITFLYILQIFKFTGDIYYLTGKQVLFLIMLEKTFLC